MTKLYDYVFSQNGLVAFKDSALIGKMSIKKNMGEENIKTFVNYVLRYIADLDIPKKRGTFIEFREGLINVCPVGRNCSQEEREEFFAYDKVYFTSYDSESAHVITDFCQVYSINIVFLYPLTGTRC